MKTLINPDDQDPNECEDCVAFGEPCPYHQGWADGWDCAASVVGALVLDQKERGR